MPEQIYSVGFKASSKDEFLKFNGKDFYFDDEVNVIENYNFQGFADQIIAIAMGWA